jgi:ATP-binding cassette, subfamily C, bacterial EexD
MRRDASPGRAALSSALRQARGAFVAVGGFSLFVNLLMLTVPMYMLQVYDRVLISRSEDTLVMLTILAVSLLAVNSVVEFFRSRILVRVGARLDEALRRTPSSTIKGRS